MAEEAALRSQLDDQRARIGHTVDQIEDRVRPSRIARRKRSEVRDRMTDWKDRVMGNDEPDHPGRGSNRDWYGPPPGTTVDDGGDGHGRLAEASDAVRDQASSVASTVADTPEMVRRRTRGNPFGPGLIAFGAGLVVATVLPETRREQQAVRKLQPELEDAAARVAETGREFAHDMEEPAKEAVASVKETASDAASDVVDDGKHAAERAT